jgi:hypothetical protein
LGDSKSAKSVFFFPFLFVKKNLVEVKLLLKWRELLCCENQKWRCGKMDGTAGIRHSRRPMLDNTKK